MTYPIPPDRTILSYLRHLYGAPRGATSDGLARAAGHSRSWANRVLGVAQDAGYVRRLGHRRGFIVYGLTDSGMSVILGDSRIAHPDAFPILADIRKRRAEASEAEEQLGGYLQAADAVRSFDPDTATALEALAAALRASALSPAECEYLKYAEAHP